MKQTAIVCLLLMATWLVLSGHFEPFYVGAGLVSCVVALWIQSRLRKAAGEPPGVIAFSYSLRTALYFPWLAREIWKAALDVTRRVWRLRPPISPTVAWVRASQPSEGGLTLFATSITLTPGTVSVDVERGRILVHSLSREGMQDLQSGAFDRKVTTACNS